MFADPRLIQRACESHHTTRMPPLPTTTPAQRRYVVYKVPEEEPEVTETEVIEPLDASELRSVDAILARAQSRMKAGIATPPSKDS